MVTTFLLTSLNQDLGVVLSTTSNDEYILEAWSFILLLFLYYSFSGYVFIYRFLVDLL